MQIGRPDEQSGANDMTAKLPIPEGFIQQAHLARVLVTEFAVPVHDVPTYRRTSYDATNMKIPSTLIGGRYYIARADIPAIIKHYSLTSTIDAPFQPASAA